MAITKTVAYHTTFFGRPAKLVKMTGGTDTSTTYVPGKGFTEVHGNYKKFTESSGTFTVTFNAAASAANDIRYVLFVAG